MLLVISTSPKTSRWVCPVITSSFKSSYLSPSPFPKVNNEIRNGIIFCIGLRFALREGGKTIASGVITKILKEEPEGGAKKEGKGKEGAKDAAAKPAAKPAAAPKK